MQQQFGADVNFIGVASRDEVAAIEGFVDRYQVAGFEHAIDIDGDVWAEYGINSQPAFAFLNDDGSVDTVVGALGPDSLTERVQQLIDT